MAADSAQSPSPGHVPIMVREVLESLAPSAGEVVADLTLGRGGHALALAERIGPSGALVGLDLDRGNLEFTRDRLEASIPEAARPALHVHHANFAQAPDILERHGLAADVVLVDLGFASNQMDDAARGFSFRDEGPLDMRLDRQSTVTAAAIVNESSERELADLIHRYGEDPFARRIARTIVAGRADEPIETTSRLAEIVRRAYGAKARHSRMHPATRTFMALRIAVNNELGSLEALCRSIGSEEEARRWLRPGARIGWLAFHSLEDRMIKQMINAMAREGRAKKLTRKPVQPGEAEVLRNPRARSAKFRAVQRIDGGEPMH